MSFNTVLTSALETHATQGVPIYPVVYMPYTGWSKMSMEAKNLAPEIQYIMHWFLDFDESSS